MPAVLTVTPTIAPNSGSTKLMMMGNTTIKAFIVVLPIIINLVLPELGAMVGVTVSTAGITHAEQIIFGTLIVWFLIVEPHGLARLWSVGKQKLRLWPFPH